MFAGLLLSRKYFRLAHLQLKLADCFGLFSGAISAMVESLGDYYAAARISGAPVPPADVLARGVTWQGISCVLTGLWGTGNGTTAYNVHFYFAV